MAHHILSVCIFCFICASHSHCVSHYAVKRGLSHINSNPEVESTAKDSDKPLSVKNSQVPARVKLKSGIKPSAESEYGENEESYEIVQNIVVKKFRNHNLYKRNSININKSDGNVNNSSEIYLKRIFNEFGDGNTMTKDGFKKFIERLELLQILSSKLDDMKNPHKENIDDKGRNKTCIGSRFVFSDYSDVNLTTTDPTINDSMLHRACPAILYNLMVGYCNEELPVHRTEINNGDLNTSVWIFSISAVIVTSACGVLALAIIPVMQKKFYKSLLQFLVALAVGTLAGDAFLHLLPHAMTSAHGTHSNNHEKESFMEDARIHNHDENMWKGVVAMMGLTFFFVMERLILLIGKWRKGRHKKAEAHSHMKFLSNGLEDLSGSNSTQCMDKYNSYPYCYRDILNHQLHGCHVENGRTASAMLDDVDTTSEISSCNKSKSPTVGKIEDNQNMGGCLSENSCTEVNVMLPENTQKSDNITIILRQHGSSHHGHSHSHGHVHAAPHNFSSVAWMVIMGDGLHNFTDGMAIGAAFSGSLAGGFSTAVAVFCHELPHELGDFAMLLKAGMTIRQALFYNLLSSVLSLLGNVVGICLGNTEYASSWVFAAAAGMFIYIALVDMIPELSSSHEDESNLTQCCLHLSGLMIGFGIMTVIAVYEQDLKSIFEEEA